MNFKFGDIVEYIARSHTVHGIVTKANPKEFLNNSELGKTLSGTTDEIVQNFISAYNELKSYVEGKVNEPI